eukprot:TRINITY_DN27697_c0_g3_i1.p1 TRINITY_DN27697_c0_g3~~TRINITY_DN27697_c0_g3_i1.p1  ORF type:complete len:488 (-),score=82.68 TRINITY_DN27697_c0_g3_i1:44-1507(-)
MVSAIASLHAALVVAAFLQPVDSVLVSTNNNAPLPEHDLQAASSAAAGSSKALNGPARAAEADSEVPSLSRSAYLGFLVHALPARVSSLLADTGSGVKQESYGLSWCTGVVGMLLGGALVATGFLVQKGAHIVHKQQLESEAAALRSSRLRRRASTPVGAYWRQRRWLLGCIPVVLGLLFCWIGQILAPGWAPLCINGWIIAFTVLVAPFCPGEHVGSSTRVGSTLIVLGCGWMLHSGPVDLYSDAVLYKAYAASATLSALLLVAAVLTIMLLCSHARKRKPDAGFLNAFESGTMAAMFAWSTWTLSRNCGAVLSSTSSPDLESLLFWLLALGGVIGFVVAVHFLNLALQHGDVSIAVPCCMGTSILGGPLFSMLLLVMGRRHGLALQPHMPALYGIGLVFAGVCCLAVSASSEEHDNAPETSAKLKHRAVARPGLFPNPDLLFARRDADDDEQPAADMTGEPPRPRWGSGLFESVEPSSTTSSRAA